MLCGRPHLSWKLRLSRRDADDPPVYPILFLAYPRCPPASAILLAM